MNTPRERVQLSKFLDLFFELGSSGSLSLSEAEIAYAITISATKITIPAVKITDAPAFPLLPTSEDSIMPPDACLSSNTNVKLAPIDSALFPVKEEKLPTLLTDEENEDEFGEFLLDAVQWL